MAGSRDERRPSEAASERGSLAPAQGPAGGGNNLRAPSRKFPAAAAAETAASSQGATNQNYAKGINAPTAPAATEPWWLADHYTYVSIDRAFKANLARLTFGFSPAVLAEQTFDWLAHLAISPRRQLQLLEKWYRKNTRIAAYAAQSLTNPPRAALHRAAAAGSSLLWEAWRQWPYNMIYQALVLMQQCLRPCSMSMVDTTSSAESNRG